VDELTLFTELKPPVPEVAPIQARARVQVVDGLHANRPRGRRFALRAGPVSGKPRRRRLALGLSAVAVAACAATVVPSVLFGGRSETLVTSAYAVTRSHDGTVTVSIYDIADAADAASLQRALRHEGVPALVWIGVPTDQNNGCQPPASRFEPERVRYAVIDTYFNGHRVGPDGFFIVSLPDHLTPAERASLKRDPGLQYVIHPSAMPSGSALYLRRFLGGGDQEIAPPEVLKHDRLPC
jgi:hypothetical protein